jgi:molybdopterin converting factor small subunit
LRRLGRGSKIAWPKELSPPGALIVEVRIRLGSGIARFSPAPRLRLELPDGSTVEDLFACLAADHPELAPALRSALPVLAGAHVERGQTLKDGDELGVLTPVAGGATRQPMRQRS